MSDMPKYSEDCLFCKIIRGDIPSEKVYEDDVCFAFRDVAPQAPTHILVVPKTHMESAAAITAENAELAAHILAVLPRIAAAEGLSAGWRLVSNIGEEGGQTVKHLHFHILGGRKLSGQLG